MKRLLTAVFVFLCAAPIATAQDIKPATFVQKPAIFVPPTGDGFEVYVAAALTKKNVPATVVSSPDSAQLTLKAAPMPVRKVRMKFSACVMGACGGGSGKPGPSAQLLDRDGAVIWSHTVETDDESTKKEVAEEIAARLKRDYFRQ
jgi:hypothetical protein